MAFSPLRSKALHHGRSLSFPSQSNPSISHFNENLAKMEASMTMEAKLNGLRNLYSNIDDLLMLPHIQHIISQECQTKWIDQVLDGYIRLLDACTTAKDLFSQIRQQVQELLSALRRNDVNGIDNYHISKKKSKKMILKSLKDLRTLRCKKNVSSLDKDDETKALVHMLKEAESVTIDVFEGLLSYVIGNNVQPKSSTWSLVSKILPSKKVSNQSEETDLNEMKEMDSIIQILEEEIECFFRQLIKTRVFLLNILNH
ncbi:hypothetical protein ABFX02_02G002600 [Erythranthe guttata]